MKIPLEKPARGFDHMPDNPLMLFQQWWQEATLHGDVQEPNAMTVATIDAQGMPHTRIVYLRDLVEEGFVFYTNYEANKSKQLNGNEHVALNFFWAAMDRQVRVCGHAEQVPAEMSDAYFAGRARQSQLGAWASPQSRPIPSREWLMDELKRMEQKFEGQEVPRPPHWGGWLVRPVSVEFWNGRTARLHDRVVFNQIEKQWKRQRLAP